MPIFTNSRYAELPITSVIDANGLRRTLIQLDVPLDPDDIGSDFSTWVWREGEELDFIAWKKWGDGYEKYWWVIAEANNIEFPLDIEVGRELIVPSRRFVDSL